MCSQLRVCLNFQRQGFARRAVPDPTAADGPSPPTCKKLDGIVQDVLRLKALIRKHAGCRKVADTFNRLHAPARVGKSFVSNTVRSHQYALLIIARALRDQRPARVRVNRDWGVDLTFVRDLHGTPRPVLGVVDHGSRVCTQLAAVVSFHHVPTTTQGDTGQHARSLMKKPQHRCAGVLVLAVPRHHASNNTLPAPDGCEGCVDILP